MQKDIWTEILGLPLSDNQSDLADALKPNLCQRPLNHDFHTLGNILFYCCPLWIGEPRNLVAAHGKKRTRVASSTAMSSTL